MILSRPVWTEDGGNGPMTLERIEAAREEGEIYNPIFRCLARFVFGYTSSLESYLKSLGGKFGEEVTPTAP